MLPFYENERKRKINLGGSTRVSSASDLLDSVKAQREARLEQKRRQDSALRIQAFYRGRSQASVTKDEMRKTFRNDVLGITGLRCLVLLGLDEAALGIWSQTVCSTAPEQVFALSKGRSWLTLVQRVALSVLTSVSRSPLSPNSLSHLQALTVLLSPGDVARAITSYLLNHDYYSLISTAFQHIPEPKSKKAPQTAPLTHLAVVPLSLYPPTSSTFVSSLSKFLVHIFTIPHLPNRIPLSTLPSFVSSIPISHLHLLSPHTSQITSFLAHQPNSVEARVHLVANCSMFFSPHYAKFGNQGVVWYLRFLAEVFGGLPVGVFDSVAQPKSKVKDKGKGKEAAMVVDADPAVPWVLPEDEARHSQPNDLLILDTKTHSRISTLQSQTHIDSLLLLARRSQAVQEAFVIFVLALGRVWPTKREGVLSTILASGGSGGSGGGLVRGLWRDVRGNSVGKDVGVSIFDPRNASAWPPLLLLAELYSQALQMMGDDEFFSSVSGPSGFSGASSTGSGLGMKNPLTMEELVLFSRMLLNVAFTLYWSMPTVTTGSSSTIAPSASGAAAAGYSWEEAREKVTRCLVGIHARDSRKPFVPPDGWLVTSSALDMRTFVQAAMLEEQQLAEAAASSSEDDAAMNTNGESRPSSLLRNLPKSRNGVSGFSARTIASFSPCLGVLNNIPFAIPFEVRVAIFRQFVRLDMQRLGIDDRYRRGGWGYGGKTRVSVRRGMVAQDGFDRLGDVDLKGPVEITFVDQFGAEEAGIDGGGVFKEFFTDLCKEVFDTDRGLWLVNGKNELYPNPHAYATEPHSLNWYRFIGRILGKAMYEGILVDVAFAGFFLAKLLGKQSFLDDLASLDPDLYKGLIFLKHYEGNPEDLSLNFTIAVDELGVTRNVELIPGGSDISVTKENRLKYITLVSHYRLSRQIRKQSEAFFEGLKEMIEVRWLRMFNQQEVQILIGGVNAPIDLDDLREHTNYGGLYDDRHPVIVAFWKVLNGFDQEQRRALLRFVTSCSRPPLLGFKELVPNFSIRDSGTDSHRLPTSSTCVNLLKLPLYSNERIMREKIVQAITSGAGFDLS
ncbi:ubiquitin protein ligase [Ephemerocybe angulata]|uniref:HECT-type E3 ubiquitin transferase n=1 Tax=Ephemerocybe angulata TaxID=980116 RepID=A0A8H6HN42_9AGAR|nr:ubiquitin protein ligase [Tulosesus angulatus]